jgi:hypothetical protein
MNSVSFPYLLKGILAMKQYQQFLTKKEGRNSEIFDFSFDDSFGLFSMRKRTHHTTTNFSFSFLDIKEFVMNEF